MSIDRIKPAPWDVQAALVSPAFRELRYHIRNEWMMWEAGGKKCFDTGYAKEDGVFGANVPLWDTGPYGCCLDFRDISGTAYTVDIPSYTPDQQGSCEVLYLHRNSSRQRLLGSGDAFELHLRWVDPNSIHNEFFQGASDVTSAFGVAIGNWYHIVSTWDYGTGAAKIYINGVLKNTTAFADDIPGTATLQLGFRTGSASTLEFRGKMSYVRFYDKPLTDSEALLLYENPFGPITRARVFPVKYQAPQTRILRPGPVDLIKPAPWDVQAGLVGKEWGWFWEDIGAFLPFWEGVGKPVDVARGIITTFNTGDGAAPIWDQDGMGRRLTADAIGSEVDLDQTLTDIVGDDDFFIAALWSPSTQLTSMVVSSGLDLTHNLGMDRGATGNIFARAFGNQVQNAGSFYVAGDILLAVMSTAGQGGALTLECRNLTTGARSRNTGTAGTTVPSGVARVFRRAANTYEMQGSVYWVALGRGLPTNDALTVFVDQLASDPFGPFRQARSIPVPKVEPTTRILRPAVNDGIKPAEWDVQAGLVDLEYRKLHDGLILGVPFWGSHVKDGGTLEDISQFQRILTIDNSLSGLAITDTPSGRAVQFSGDDTNDRIGLGSIPSTDPLSLSGTSAATIAFWVRPNAFGSWPGGSIRVIDKSNGAGTANGWAAAMYNSGSARYVLLVENSGSEFWEGWLIDSFLDDWHFYLFRWAGTDIECFVDGKDQGSPDATFGASPPGLPASTTTTNAAIGNWNHEIDKNFSGDMGTVYVWDRALSDSEIQALATDPFGLIRRARSIPVPAPTVTVSDLEQTLEGFRWRNDDGSESAATWAQVQDAYHTIGVDGETRLRIVLQAPEGGQLQLDCAKDGTEDWFKVD